jgi:hypothetical protein
VLEQLQADFRDQAEAAMSDGAGGMRSPGSVKDLVWGWWFWLGVFLVVLTVIAVLDR